MVASIMTCIARLICKHSINRRPAHSLASAMFSTKTARSKWPLAFHRPYPRCRRPQHDSPPRRTSKMVSAYRRDGHHANRNVHLCQLGESLFICRVDRDNSFERGLYLELVVMGKLRPAESETASCDDEATNQHGRKNALEMIAAELPRGVFQVFERFVHRGGRLFQ